MELFQSAASPDEDTLEETRVVSLMKKINTTITTSVICQKLKELEMKRADGKRGRLSSDEFISLFKEISTRPEIYFLLVR
ncbi:phosphoinositide phospholipase c [Plakobranchus ocellatus]|uniref:Phosphoinositide phospholipase c n=1 Tax=Plakobranchus ocellatus TaxID=259542 RepID=A0AAV4E313_9GAST|nr:phosphoinositide phospholipase c [Plakobranchus ocellatus]